VFLGAGGAETGADLIEVGVRITGMAYEFPGGGGVGWHRRQQAAEGLVDVRGSGGEDTDGAAGGGEPGGEDRTLEGSVLGLEGDDRETAEGRDAFGGAEGPGRLERIADGWDAAGASGAEERTQDSWKKVRVLVRIDVGDVQTGALQAADLGGSFRDDFRGADAESEEVADEGSQCWPEGLAVGAEGWDLGRREGRGSIDKKDVAADFEAWIGSDGGDGVVEEGTCGHKGRGGERVALVEFGDGAIDAGSEAEVVGVDDEGHGISVQRSAIRAVDGWVEGGVVVHLELAVDFEAARAGEDVGPELVEAGDEVVALFGEKSETLAVAFIVAFRRIGASDFFLSVEDFEGEDGEAVDHEAWAFGAQLSR
jgi:hypothetical protein